MASADEVAAMKAEIIELQTVSKTLMQQLQQQAQQQLNAAAATAVDAARSVTNQTVGFLTSKKSFAVLKTYKGKVEDYEAWRFKTARFLCEEPVWPVVLKDVEAMTTLPDGEQMKAIGVSRGWEVGAWEAQAKLMSNQLYNALCQLLEDKASTTARNLEDHDWCGMACWWKLAQECSANSAQRVQGLILRINSPKRVKKYSEVLAALDAWETDVKIYEDRKGKIDDDMKLASIRQIVPEDLDRDIYRDYSERTYAETMAYIVKQVGIRRDMKSSGGMVPMDCDSLEGMNKEEASEVYKLIQNLQNMMGGGEGAWQGDCDGDHKNDTKDSHDHHHHQGQCDGAENANPLMNTLNSLNSMLKGKGGKGYGKGKGKGFQGNCNHCGKFGHTKRECRVLDAEMAAIRAQNGKGGGKGYQGKGYQGRGYQGKNWNGGQKGGGGHGYQFGDNGGKGGYPGNTLYTGGGGGWNGNNWNGDQGQGPAAWALSCRKVDADYTPAKNTVKAQNAKTVMPPPGLNRFQVLHSDDEDSEIKSFMNQAEKIHDFPVLRMANYSKKSVQVNLEEKRDAKAKNKAEKKETSAGYQTNNNTKKKNHVWKPLPLNLFEKATTAESPKILSPFMGNKPDANGYTSVTSVMDSGASESVAPASMCPLYPVKPSVGSLAGQKYLSASDDLIPNLGEQHLPVVTETGREGVVKYQIAEVSRPLTSVSEICDAGGQVVFGKNGGVIVNLTTGAETPFHRENGVYTLQMWVKPQAGFAGRG